MGVASCRSAFLCLMMSVRLVPFRISVRDLIPFSGPRSSWVFDPRSGPAQPSLVQPSSAGPARPGLRAPGAQNPPCAPNLSPSLIWISRATTSPLPLPPLSPRGALGFGDGDHRILDPEVSSPPLLFSLSLSLLFFPPRAPSLSPCPRSAPLGPPRRRSAPLGPPSPPARARPRPPPLGPTSALPGGARPPAPARPAAAPRSAPSAPRRRSAPLGPPRRRSAACPCPVPARLGRPWPVQPPSGPVQPPPPVRPPVPVPASPDRIFARPRSR
jgi:hypothetical protein